MTRRSGLTTLLAGAALALGSLLPAGASAQQRALTYSSYLPPSHGSNRDGLIPLFQEAERATGGSLRIQLHTGGSLVAGPATLSAIRTGLVDGGFVVSLYHPNQIPLNTAMSDLALLAADPLATMGAINETVLLNCPDCLAEYRRNNTVYVGAYSTTPYRVMCRQPVRSMDDLRGLRMRAAGNVYGRWAQRMGGVGVNIPNAEAYEALERGQLDCVIGSVAWLETLSLWDVAKNVVDLPMGAYFGGALIAFNRDSWNGIRAEDRAAFLRLVPRALAQVAVGYVCDDETVERRARERGVTTFPPDPALTRLLEEYNRDEVRNAIAVARQRGARNPEPVIEAFLANLRKWREIVQRTGVDVDRFEQALRTEIYDRARF
ncbi:C4-dicarboxylate TRAP transporter substrate-binding protein [Siccirubricoccus phaeus]|uniref:C4-dicarboxylate TRAP transporter substrate-binding protein n=1 Tax=Siccirubricoccus phaeus TaxID=2595053 RepID=UPI0011F2E319|nr:C4-dicarboxylate TRAP transporter substrate-binding protein [Siccirubricoccus phaeus]